MRITDFVNTPAIDNVKEALRRARENEAFNALISLTEERALDRAAMVDSGEISGKLKGVPFIVKDNFLAYGAPSTAASKMLEGFNAPLQAEAVERLEAEGAICIGKANLDAFAHGGSTENSAFGVTKNATDTMRVAGGSSGGSAVSVALEIVPFALGTDTGGSIRQPASFNGVIGVKPTYGAVSRYGVVAMASSTDTVGCFAQTADDASLVMSIMSGLDEKDATTLSDFWSQPVEPSKKRVGVIKQFMTSDVNEDIRNRVTEYALKMQKAGYSVEEAELPMAKYSLGAYYIVVSAEVMSNLARYDGVRYGLRPLESRSLEDVFSGSRSQGFELENKRRIMIGSFVLSRGFFDEYYLKAQKARTMLINELKSLFERYDILLGPVAPTTAFRIGENVSDPVKMYLADIMTAPASLAGLPALSVPAGVDGDGLPVGVQLIGSYRTDRMLLDLASQIEEV